MLSACWCCVSGGLLYSGHDVSDGGLITCLLEMAFAGNCSIDADFITDNPGLHKSRHYLRFVIFSPCCYVLISRRVFLAS